MFCMTTSTGLSYSSYSRYADWRGSYGTCGTTLVGYNHTGGGHSQLQQIIGIETWVPKVCSNYKNVFRGCVNLVSIDLSAFVYNTVDFSFAFAECVNLTTIYGPSNNALLNRGSAMFGNCYKLLGEGGTSWTNISALGIPSYSAAAAKFDDGSTSPGYFWRKN